MTFSNRKSGRIDQGEFRCSDFYVDRQPEIVIWPPERQYLCVRKYDRYRRNSNGKPGVSSTVRAIKVFPGYCNNDRQPEIANETGTTDIAETIAESITIPTANLAFTTMESSEKVSASVCDKNGRPEIARLAPV